MTKSSVPTEQVSADLLIEGAWAEFNRKSLSCGALYVLWGSFESADELMCRYFAAKGEKELLDKRRRLTPEQEERLEGVRYLAQQALDYRNWVRGEAGEQVLRDALVGYCAAFENALKVVALAFRVADACKENAGASFIEGAKLKKMRRDVGDCWKAAAKSAAGGEPCGAERFYVDYVLKKNPCPDKWPFKQPSDVSLAKYKISPKDYWPDVAMAFKLRNKILHQNGYLDERLEIAGQVMHESAEVQLELSVVNRVHAAFRSLLDPMDTESIARHL